MIHNLYKFSVIMREAILFASIAGIAGIIVYAVVKIGIAATGVGLAAGVAAGVAAVGLGVAAVGLGVAVGIAAVGLGVAATGLGVAATGLGIVLVAAASMSFTTAIETINLLKIIGKARLAAIAAVLAEDPAMEQVLAEDPAIEQVLAEDPAIEQVLAEDPAIEEHKPNLLLWSAAKVGAAATFASSYTNDLKNMALNKIKLKLQI